MHYLSMFSTVIAFAFTYYVLARYHQRGGAHLLLWGMGLIFFGLGTFSEIVLGFTFNEWVLKVWYVSGAILTAAWLGQGTVNLLVRKTWITKTTNLALMLLSLVAFALVLNLSINTQAAALYDPAIPASGINPAMGNLLSSRGEPLAQYQAVMNTHGPILALTILFNLYGTLGLVGGAIYSAYIFWRKKVLLNRMLGNILIAAGGLLPAIGGTHVRTGTADWLYISEFLGLILMFSGFIQATAVQTVQEAQAVGAD
ncbi:MAG: hypothetical protein MUC85_07035 [Anaerolineales bacterium]|jgi:hypothetical protein|nr:hypothetical protein [Anaerolineales bacterium]